MHEASLWTNDSIVVLATIVLAPPLPPTGIGLPCPSGTFWPGAWGLPGVCGHWTLIRR